MGGGRRTCWIGPNVRSEPVVGRGSAPRPARRQTKRGRRGPPPLSQPRWATACGGVDAPCIVCPAPPGRWCLRGEPPPFPPSGRPVTRRGVTSSAAAITRPADLPLSVHGGSGRGLTVAPLLPSRGRNALRNGRRPPPSMQGQQLSGRRRCRFTAANGARALRCRRFSRRVYSATRRRGPRDDH